MEKEAKQAEAGEQTERATKGKREFIDQLAKMVKMDPAGYEVITREIVKKSVGRDLTDAEYAYFMSVAAKYKLDPMMRQIYCFIKKVKDKKTGKHVDAGIQIAVEYDGWIKIVNSHPDFDGMDPIKYEYGPKGELISATITFYRKGKFRGISTTIFYQEFYREKNPVWKKMPRWMCGVRAYCQGGRRAYGISDIIDPDEAMRWVEIDLLANPDGRTALEPESRYSEDATPPPASTAAPESKEPHMSSKQKYTLIGCAKKAGADQEQLIAFLKVKGLEFDSLTIGQASDLIGQWKGKGDVEPDFEDIQAWLMEQGQGVPAEEFEQDMEMGPPPSSTEDDTEPETMPEEPDPDPKDIDWKAQPEKMAKIAEAGAKIELMDEIKVLADDLKFTDAAVRTMGKNITNRKVKKLNEYGIEELKRIYDTMKSLEDAE